MNVSFFRERRPSRSEDEDKTQRSTSKLLTIRSELVRKILCDVIEDQLQTNVFQIGIQSEFRKHVNSTSTVYRVLYQALDRQNRVTSSSLILKHASDDECDRVHLNIRKRFLREIYIYDEIFSCIQQFEQSMGIREDQGFYEHPKYYKKINSELVECIFLEDVTQNGFVELNQDLRSMSVQHVLLVMKALGKLHAASLALKDQKRRIFDGMIGEFNQIKAKDRTTKWAQMLSSTPKFIMDATATSNNNHILNKVLRFYERSQFDIGMECIDSNGAEPLAVITHGDCWSKNTLFKYNGRTLPMKTCLIDWKLSKYCSPICDVVQFIFCSTTKQQRDVYYDTFLKAYHESVTHQLTKLGSDPCKIFPIEELLGQLNRFGCYGLITASYILPHIILGIDFDGSSRVSSEVKVVDSDEPDAAVALNERLRDIVHDMVRLGYI